MNTKENNLYEVPIEAASEVFASHLNRENNKRILFSAPFGAGKTYFLKKFFNDEKKYKLLHLFPINYAVSTNEDIFELIKYDILLKLMAEDLQFDKAKFSKWFKLQSFIHYKPLNFLKSVLGVINKLGQSPEGILTEQLIESYEGASKEFNEFSNSVEYDDKAKAINYLNGIVSKRGTPKEDDYITILINSLIDQIRNKDKEAVLIIDDLDRIDPEHIFRLLNIFAAHFDVHEDSNKFNFDRVIFVCDINNLRTIFGSKYGVGVDFSGYIDKFYSTEIFHFDNKKDISATVLTILKSIKTTTDQAHDEDSVLQYNISYGFTDNLFCYGCAFLLRHLIYSGVLSIRRLTKVYGITYHSVKGETTYNFSNKNISYGASDSFNVFVSIIKFLAKALGGSEELAGLITKAASLRYELDLKDNDSAEDTPQVTAKLCVIASAVAMIDVRRHNFNPPFNPKENPQFSQTIADLDLNISYELRPRIPNRGFQNINGIKSGGIYAYPLLISNTQEDPNSWVAKIELFEVLRLALARMNEYKVVGPI